MNIHFYTGTQNMYHAIQNTSNLGKISCSEDEPFQLVSLTFGEIRDDKHYCIKEDCNNFDVTYIE